MMWVFFVDAVLSWGVYGPALHKGQTMLGNPLKALLCVGVAYFLNGILVPVISLSSQGGLRGFDTSGSIWAGIGGAPLINVIVSMAVHTPKTAPNPILYVGYVLAALGGGLVLYYKPS
jgi:hypothetical protein